MPKGTSGDPESVLSSAHSKTDQVTDEDGDPTGLLGKCAYLESCGEAQAAVALQSYPYHSGQTSCPPGPSEPSQQLLLSLQGGAAYQGQKLTFIFFKLHGGLGLPSL